ncbi:MAG: acyl-CoA dehydrogenase family protein [Deltaproteobacteria bacterium]|nr:acyl-CoA dehydrogenase family protein [Deltaproteobacteria bacterium]
MTDSIYTEEHHIFRNTFKKFVAKEITPNVAQWESERAVPRELWIKMGEQGFLCPWLPEEYGQLGIFSILLSAWLKWPQKFSWGEPFLTI